MERSDPRDATAQGLPVPRVLSEILRVEYSKGRFQRAVAGDQYVKFGVEGKHQIGKWVMSNRKDAGMY